MAFDPDNHVNLHDQHHQPQPKKVPINHKTVCGETKTKQGIKLMMAYPHNELKHWKNCLKTIDLLLVDQDDGIFQFLHIDKHNKRHRFKCGKKI
jgi:hypothetical protein